MVLFSGRITDAKSIPVHVRVVPQPDPATPDEGPQPIAQKLVITSESGSFSGATGPVALDIYDVRATWSTDAGTVTMSVEVKPPEGEGKEEAGVASGTTGT
jgi:hypothetical protein